MKELSNENFFIDNSAVCLSDAEEYGLNDFCRKYNIQNSYAKIKTNNNCFIVTFICLNETAEHLINGYLKYANISDLSIFYDTDNEILVFILDKLK